MNIRRLTVELTTVAIEATTQEPTTTRQITTSLTAAQTTTQEKIDINKPFYIVTGTQIHFFRSDYLIIVNIIKKATKKARYARWLRW